MSQDDEALEVDDSLLERDLDGWNQDRAAHNLRPISTVRKLQRGLGLEHTLHTPDTIARSGRGRVTMARLRCRRMYG